MTLLKIYTKRGLAQEIETADEVTAIKTDIVIPVIYRAGSSSYIEKKRVREAIEKINPVTQDEFARGVRSAKKQLLKKLGLSEEK